MKYLMKSLFTLMICVNLCSSDLFAQCSPVLAVEAVFNGDFEKGYLKNSGTTYADGSPRGFTSQVPPAGDYNAVAHNCYDSFDNTFAIAKPENGFTCPPVSNQKPYVGPGYINVPFTDHTAGKGGAGFAYLIDYAGSTGATKTIWSQNVSVIANQNYYMSAYFARYNRFNGWTGTLRFYATGNVTGTRDQVATVSITAGQMVWVQFSNLAAPWNSGVNTSAIIDIDFLAGGGGDADDIALDDISFINSCQNLSNTNTLKPNLGAEVDFCQTNGNYTLNSGLKTKGPGRTFTWYSGTGATKSILVNSSPKDTTFTVTDPGTYEVCVYEPSSSTCPAYSTVVVNKNMTVTVSGSDICNPASSTISTTVTPTPTTGTYKYTWTGATPDPGNVASFTATSGGTYNVKVENIDVAVCTATDSKTIVNKIPTVGIPAEQCQKASNVTMTGLGTGTNAVNYKWFDALTGGTQLSAGANPVFTFPATGTIYTVYAEFDPACLRTRVDIPIKTCCIPPVFTTQPTDKSVCEATANVSLDIVLAATPASMIVQWQKVLKASDTVSTNASNFSNITNTTNKQLFNTIALSDSGWYRAVATTSIANCTTSSWWVQLKVNPKPAVTATASKTICTGSPVILSGAGASKYTWDNAVTDGVSFTPNSTATYTVTGTDANGCKNTAQTIIKVDQLPVITNINLDQVMCGANSFSKMVALTADTANSTYTYTATATSPLVTGYSTVNAGTSVSLIPAEGITTTSAVQETVTYTVIVTSPKGCVGANPQNFTVKVDPPADQPVFSKPLTPSVTICTDVYDLALNPMTTGTLTWSSDLAATFTPASGPATTANQTTMGGIAKGKTYVVTVVNKNGVCPDKQATVTIRRFDDITQADAGKDQTDCYNASGHTFTLSGNAVNTANNETSTWAAFPGNAVLSSPNGTANSVDVLVPLPGSYRYVYTISNSVCPEDTNSVLVTMLPPVDLTSPVTSITVCAIPSPASKGQIEITNPQIGTTYSIRLSPNDPVLATVTATAATPVPLPVTIDADQLPVDGPNILHVYATLGGDCPEQLLIDKPVVNKVRPAANIAAVPVLTGFNDFLLDGSASLVPAGGTYAWNALKGGSISGDPALVLTKGTPFELISEYQLTVGVNIGTNACISTATVRVEVRLPLEFPNVFSPNNDGVHDFFKVKNSEFFRHASMEIFNQWGDKVYVKTGGYQANWDGTHNHKELPVATYYYIFTPNQSGYEAVAGSISILR